MTLSWRTTLLITVLTIVLGIFTPAHAQPHTTSNSPEFVGSESCRICHGTQVREVKLSTMHSPMLRLHTLIRYIAVNTQQFKPIKMEYRIQLRGIP